MTKLDRLISDLMKDDDLLNRFLVDPITIAEKDYGLSKAQRSVLRRSLHHLSNNSVNGYGMQRSLGSFRRSLRLVQNVMHSYAGEAMAAASSYNYYIYVYYNGRPGNYTGASNSDVAYPYARYLLAGSNAGDGVTIQEAMNHATILYGPNTGGNLMDIYATNDDLGNCSGANDFVVDFNLNGNYYADLCQYTLHDDYVFWLWSVNGLARPSTTGGVGRSFTQHQLNSGDVVFWQLIAPDAQYGFHPCYSDNGNQYYEKGARTMQNG
ncbi:MAG: hypothetical protein AAF998_21140 [Bacteroidota bacterium]